MTFEQLKTILNDADEELLKADATAIVGNERFELDIVQSGTTSEFLFIPVFGSEQEPDAS
jgi:hypothetical protein